MRNNNLSIRQYCDAAKPTNPKPNEDQLVGKWLLGCSGMVFTAVVLGGVVYYIVLYDSTCKVIEKGLEASNASK